MQPKTTLVAGAPWPEVGEWPVAKEKTPSKVKAKATDENYEKWTKKNKDALVTGSKLGMSIKQEIKQKTKKVKVKKPEVYKRPDLAPKEFFIFQKARPSK